MSERAQGAGGGAQIVLSQETPSAPRALRPAPSLLRELAVAAFYVALTLYFTWPLAARLTTAVSDEGDPLLNAWILDWDCYALAHQPLHLFDAPIFVPGHLPLAYSENLLGVAIPLFPAWLAGASAITLHGLATLLGFALSAYGAYVLARVVTGNTAASMAAGIFYAFVSFRISHTPHVQIVSAGWLPLILAALIVFHRNPTRRNAALLCGAMVMNGLTNIYFLMFSTVAVVLTIWLFAIAERRDAVYWRRLIAAIVVAIVILLPVLAPYAIVSNEYRMKRMGAEVASSSATWSDWLVPAPDHKFYSHMVDPELVRPERQLFPGFLPLLLLLWSAVATPPLSDREPERRQGRRTPYLLDVAILLAAVLSYFSLVRSGELRPLGFSGSDIPLTLLAVLVIVRFTLDGKLRAWLASSRFSLYAWGAMLWIVVGFVGSFGRNNFFGEFLFRRTTVFRSLRALCRFAAISYVGLAVWMAVGAVALLAHVPRPTWRRALAALLVAAAFVDVWPLLTWQYVWFQPSEAQLWLKQNGATAGGLPPRPTRAPPADHERHLGVRAAGPPQAARERGAAPLRRRLHRHARAQRLRARPRALRLGRQVRPVDGDVDRAQPAQRPDDLRAPLRSLGARRLALRHHAQRARARRRERSAADEVPARRGDIQPHDVRAHGSAARRQRDRRQAARRRMAVLARGHPRRHRAHRRRPRPRPDVLHAARRHLAHLAVVPERAVAGDHEHSTASSARRSREDGRAGRGRRQQRPRDALSRLHHFLAVGRTACAPKINKPLRSPRASARSASLCDAARSGPRGRARSRVPPRCRRRAPGLREAARSRAPSAVSEARSAASSMSSMRVDRSVFPSRPPCPERVRRRCQNVGLALATKKPVGGFHGNEEKERQERPSRFV